MTTWLSLHLPALPLQVCTRTEHAAEIPLAVFSPAPRSRLVAANARALAAGLRPGLGLASALALAPGLVARPRNPDGEAALLAELACWAAQFSPQLALDPPDCVVLDVGASLTLFGGLHELMARIAHGVAALGLQPALAAAPTPLAARWLAVSGGGRIVEHAEDLPARLAPLPVGVLACTADDRHPVRSESIELLEAIGIGTLGQCLQLPRDGLAKREAQGITRALDRALGRLPDPRPPFVPPQVFRSRIELPVPSADTGQIGFAVRRLLAALAGHLAAHQAGIEHYRLRLEHDDLPATTLTVHLGVASRDEARCNLLAQEHLAALQFVAPAIAVGLEAAEILPLPGETATLFGAQLGNPRDQAAARSLLVERLRARLGDSAVIGIAGQADHRPERAWQAIAPRGAAARRDDACATQPRPVWLLSEPRPLAASDRLQLLAGPERIESGWWDGHDIARDYHLALGPQGRLLWVYRELRGEAAWFVHGIFA
ncbi:MAG: DNA polymerase Y family protein [Rhodocyclaceae bacterium]|nr:MAG: DNA polymerase Y family protein [Rhodocyclaceae bacterium]